MGKAEGGGGRGCGQAAPWPDHEAVVFDGLHTLSDDGTAAFMTALQFGPLPARRDCVLRPEETRFSSLGNLTEYIERCADRSLLRDLRAAGYRTGLTATSWLANLFHPDDIDFHPPFLPCQGRSEG